MQGNGSVPVPRLQEGHERSVKAMEKVFEEWLDVVVKNGTFESRDKAMEFCISLTQNIVVMYPDYGSISEHLDVVMVEQKFRNKFKLKLNQRALSTTYACSHCKKKPTCDVGKITVSDRKKNGGQTIKVPLQCPGEFKNTDSEPCATLCKVGDDVCPFACFTGSFEKTSKAGD